MKIVNRLLHNKIREANPNFEAFLWLISGLFIAVSSAIGLIEFGLAVTVIITLWIILLRFW